AVPAEWLASQRGDPSLPADWAGAVIRPSDAIAPVEWLSAAVRDGTMPGEFSGALLKDANISGEWLLALRGDPAGLLEWLASQQGNPLVSLEWLGRLTLDQVAIDEWIAQQAAINQALPDEGLNSQRADGGALLESRASQQSNPSMPSEWSGALLQVANGFLPF